MPDTAGAGTMRGGVTMGLAVTPHDADEIHTMVVGHGVQVPNSVGQFGGMPGACAYHLLRKSNAGIAELIGGNSHMHDLLNAGGSVQRFDSKPGHFLLHRGDVLAYSFQGGGGYGDPILRDPERVARDVHNGLATPHWAAALYGVVLRDGAVDAEATRARRCAPSAPSVSADAPPRPKRPLATTSPPFAPLSTKPNASAASAAPISVPQPKAGSHAPAPARSRPKPSGRI
jgi:N-methylhydantoinase B